MSNKNKNIYDFSIKLDNDYYFVNGSIYKRVDIDINNNNVNEEEKIIENFASSTDCGDFKYNIPNRCVKGENKQECQQRIVKYPNCLYDYLSKIVTINNEVIESLKYKNCLKDINDKINNAEKSYSSSYNNKGTDTDTTRHATRNTAYENIIKDQKKIINKTHTCITKNENEYDDMYGNFMTP